MDEENIYHFVSANGVDRECFGGGNLGCCGIGRPREKESRLVQREKLPGIDVLSPSWFVIENAQGKIKTRHGSVKYVRQAHNKGYQVWALITNNLIPK